ncbi:hypothetical protein [Nonomuraea sp. NPDC049725]|uniref:hypothetical protein n=1 Tax=Nonomuraea sp. NPDC049725 TaxID=3154508 RepID=UPI0034127482
MTAIVKTEQMPGLVRAARVILIVQLAFSLFGLVLISPVITVMFSEPRVAALLLVSFATVVLMGVLISRWSSRRKWVRWGGIAFETVLLASNLILTAIDGEFSWLTPISPGIILPLAIVVALLRTPAAHWFDR